MISRVDKNKNGSIDLEVRIESLIKQSVYEGETLLYHSSLHCGFNFYSKMNGNKSLYISIIFLIANISWNWRLTRVAFSFLIDWLIQEFLEMMLAQASSGLNDEKLDIEDIFKVMKKLFFFRPFIDLFLISPCSFGGSYPLLFLSGVRPEWRWTNFWRRAQDDNGQSWWGPHRRRGKKADWRKKVLRNFKDFG